MPRPVAVAALSMPAKFSCNPLDLALGVRKHRAVVLRLRDFVWRPGLGQELLQFFEGFSANSTTLTTEDDETNGPVERGDFSVAQSARDFFGKPKPRDSLSLTISLLYVVVDFNFPVPYLRGLGKRGEPIPYLTRDELVSIDNQPRRAELVH
jgi:hypothetical protein